MARQSGIQNDPLFALSQFQNFVPSIQCAFAVPMDKVRTAAKSRNFIARLKQPSLETRLVEIVGMLCR